MNLPQHITVRLGEDFNWWVESADVLPPRGVLDPRQLAHLAETLETYRDCGYRPQQLTAAFHAYRIDAEISEGVLRLAAAGQSVLEETGKLFALPAISSDGNGPYFDLLHAISTVRIRKLNATHHYARNCTEDELVEELEMLDADRYFSDDTIHVFDELSEILEWSPAQWDESSSS